MVLRQLISSNRTDAVALHKGLMRLCRCIISFSGREGELVQRIRPVYACIMKALRLIYEITVLTTTVSACSDVIKLFQTFLSRFYQIALDEVARREQEEQNKSRKPKSNSRVVKTTGKEDEQRCHGRLTALTQMMSLLFGSLDTSQRADGDVYEALVTTLFDHIGSELSILVFHDPELPEKGLAPVTGLLDTIHIPAETSIACAELCAPYLVRLLKAALAAARADQSQHVTASTGRKGCDGPIGAKEVSHVTRAEERLQHTLLRGIFGDDDGSFKHAFARRDETEVEVNRADEEEEQLDLGPVDFVGQVWELLGWDILSGHMGSE